MAELDWKSILVVGAEGYDARVRREGNKFVFERRPVAVEITGTSECTAELVKSQHSDGYYVAVKYRNKIILTLGINDASKAILAPGYVIRKARGAIVSFHLVKE